jgi:hypothetical protein
MKSGMGVVGGNKSQKEEDMVAEREALHKLHYGTLVSLLQVRAFEAGGAVSGGEEGKGVDERGRRGTQDMLTLETVRVGTGRPFPDSPAHSSTHLGRCA